MDVQSCSSPSPGREVKAPVEDQLRLYLGPEYISYRKGEGNRMLPYVEGHEVINLMNEMFGWDGWNSKVVSSTIDYAEASNGGKWSVGVAATVRLTVTVKCGRETREVWHEDTGYGTIENGQSRGKAMEKCRKEAVTDGLKRAGRQFGNATGNCLYNKEYLERVKKVKGPAERIDFVEEKLYCKPMNKRKRFMMAQEKALLVNGTGEGGKEEEFEDEDGGEFFRALAASEEVLVV